MQYHLWNPLIDEAVSSALPTKVKLLEFTQSREAAKREWEGAGPGGFAAWRETLPSKSEIGGRRNPNNRKSRG